MVETDVKNVFWKVFFSTPGLPFFFFFCVVLPFTCYMLFVFCFTNTKLSTVFWVFDWSVLCLEVKCWCFSNTFEFLLRKNQMWLCVINACKHWNKSKPKTARAHTQLDFPLGYWTWVVMYKANYFGWKITKKVLKLTKLMTQISMFRLIYEKVTQSLFWCPVY